QQPAPCPTAGCRAAPVNFHEDPSSGEDFDFTGLDEQSADEDVQHAQRLISPTSVEPVVGPATSTRPVTPSEQASEASWSLMALDIDLFFERRSKVPPVTRTLSKTCKVNRIDLHPGAGSFSATTSNDPLCKHLTSHHKDIYLQKCWEMRWKVPILESEIRTAPAAPGREMQCPPFSQKAFIQHLLNFIVVDDQSIYVVECLEFRQLLSLLCEELQDKDIPHQTKMHESIIKAWDLYFKVLKQELAVCCFN
ncbi:hypothetical protein L208DRAFT_1311746, partial [Tricholoma matsutake]